MAMSYDEIENMLHKMDVYLVIEDLSNGLDSEKDESKSLSQALVRIFNATCPPGTRVRAYPGTRSGRGVDGRTTSEAYILGDGRPVVRVDCGGGLYALTHIDVIGEEFWDPGSGDSREDIVARLEEDDGDG